MFLNSSVHKKKLEAGKKNPQKWLSKSEVGPKNSLHLSGNPGNSDSRDQQTGLYSKKGILGLICSYYLYTKLSVKESYYEGT